MRGGAPLSDAVVSVARGGGPVVVAGRTGESGEFRFDGLAPGDYNVSLVREPERQPRQKSRLTSRANTS